MKNEINTMRKQNNKNACFCQILKVKAEMPNLKKLDRNPILFLKKTNLPLMIDSKEAIKVLQKTYFAFLLRHIIQLI